MEIIRDYNVTEELHLRSYQTLLSTLNKWVSDYPNLNVRMRDDKSKIKELIFPVSIYDLMASRLGQKDSTIEIIVSGDYNKEVLVDCSKDILKVISNGNN